MPETNDKRSIRDRLQRLEDQFLIHDTVASYGPALDGQDLGAFMKLWAEDATMVWPGHEQPIVGRNKIAQAFGERQTAQGSSKMHSVSNVRVSLADDRAHVHSNWVLFGADDGGIAVSAFGHYEDVLEQNSDGSWRFSLKRTIVTGVRGK